MWSRFSVILIALALQYPFVGKSADTLQQRYGKPVSGVFLVRPGVVVSAIYGESGRTCVLDIRPKPNDVSPKESTSSDELDEGLLTEITEELVPKSERGKFKISTFEDIVCIEEDGAGGIRVSDANCAGVLDDWEKLTIYRDSGQKGPHYERIKWKRRECARFTK